MGSRFKIGALMTVSRIDELLTQTVWSFVAFGCFRPSDRLAGRDSHPLEIADFHGVPSQRQLQSAKFRSRIHRQDHDRWRLVRLTRSAMNRNTHRSIEKSVAGDSKAVRARITP